ncbi:hypothetical protein HK105_208538 [Polyrhizophydium stewartii]|uniref:NAD-dependent protein deacylase n=1 Tax=Polyrhizophydium stewartii TaxID=2732419 RepID=A0ABR4MXK5_9FUNG
MPPGSGFPTICVVVGDNSAMQNVVLGPVRTSASRLREFLLRNEGRTVVLTGAGVSTDSGIPDYRGPAGVYSRNKDYKPIQYQQFVGPHSFRQRYWARSFLGWPQISSARPNTSHKAIAALEAASHITGVVTQNVDGLHSAAGSRAVIEIHGTLHLVECIDCHHQITREQFQTILREMNPVIYEWSRRHPGKIESDVSSSVNPDGDVEITWDYSHFQYPACPKCSGMLKPNVVFFGENMPARVRDASFKMLDDAGALLIIGSSLQVYSALRLAKRAHEAGKPIALLNLGPTRGDGMVELRLEHGSSEVLEELVGQLA